MKRYTKVRKTSRSKSTIVAMGQKYDHLSYEDRVKIEHWHKNGKSIRCIAGELGRSVKVPFSRTPRSSSLGVGVAF